MMGFSSNQQGISGNAAIKLKNKLTRLKNHIKARKLCQADTASGSIKSLKEKMIAWDAKAESGLLTTWECEKFGEDRHS